MKKVIYLSILAVLFFSTSSFVNPNKAAFSTSLKITVLDGLGNFVEGAKVTLYSNEEDFKKSENPVQESQLTDKKGRVTFRDLQPQAYFVDVVKDKLTNYGGAQLTSELAENKMNKVNIVIE